MKINQLLFIGISTAMDFQGFMPDNNSANTHSLRMKVYQPESKFVTSIPDSLSSTVSANSNSVTHFLSSQTHIPSGNLVISDHQHDSLFDHFTFDHVVEGKRVVNHAAKVSMARGNLVSYSYTFSGPFQVEDCVTPKSKDELILEASRQLQAQLESQSTVLDVLVDVGKNRLVPATWMQLAQEGEPRYEVALDNCNGNIVYFVNYVA